MGFVGKADCPGCGAAGVGLIELADEVLRFEAHVRAKRVGVKVLYKCLSEDQDWCPRSRCWVGEELERELRKKEVVDE